MRFGVRGRAPVRGLALLAALLSPIVASSAAPDAPDEPLLPFATYLGGSDIDSAGAVAVGSDGVIWIAAATSSDDFPGAPRAVPSTEHRPDVVVLRVDPATHAVLSTLRLGGSGWDSVAGLAVDDQGNAYVAGTAGSDDFPLTAGALGRDSWGRATSSTYVARIRPDGSGFAWVYAFGGSGWYQSTGAMCLTADGDPVVVGTTTSADFPLVAPLDATYGGDGSDVGDAYVVRLRADGTGPVFATYLGGAASDSASSVCVARSGRIVVGGQTSSADFVGDATPIVGATSGPPYYASYLAELEPSGASLLRVAPVGVSIGLVAPTADALILVGRADAGNGLPFAPPSPTATDHYFLLRLDASSWAPSGGTFLGPALKSESIDAVSVAADGTVWVAGAWGPDATNATRLPVPGAPRPHPGDMLDAYVAAFEPAGFTQTFGTYLGGSGRDFATAIAVAGDGSAWVVGDTASIDFPTAHPIQGSLATTETFGSNLFVARTLVGDPALRPAAVAQVDASPVDGHSILVAWSPADDSGTAFGIDRTESLDAGMFESWTRVALVGADAREWTDTGLLADHRYGYSVQAVNAAGGSPASDTFVTATPATMSFTVEQGKVLFPWGLSERIRSGGDLYHLRGTLLRAGRAPDVVTEGVRLLIGELRWNEEILVVAPGDTRWRVDRRGVLRWRQGRSWIELDPTTGSFDLRALTRGTDHSSLIERDPPMPLRLLVGDDAGSVAPTWRPIKPRDRGFRMRRIGARTP